MKLVQKSLHLDGLTKYSSLFFIAFILWAVGRGQNPLDTRYIVIYGHQGHLRTPTNNYGHLRTSMAPADIYGHLWAPGTFMDTYKHVTVGNTAYLVPIDTYGRPQPSIILQKYCTQFESLLSNNTSDNSKTKTNDISIIANCPYYSPSKRCFVFKNSYCRFVSIGMLLCVILLC